MSLFFRGSLGFKNMISMKNQAGHKQKLGRLSDQDIWLKAYSGHFDTATVGRLELQNKNIAFLPKIIQTFTGRGGGKRCWKKCGKN